MFMEKKIVALITLDANVRENEMNDYIRTEFGWLANSGMHLEDFSDVPYNTTLKEIQDAIIQNRAEKIEEEYNDDLQELA